MSRTPKALKSLKVLKPSYQAGRGLAQAPGTCRLQEDRQRAENKLQAKRQALVSGFEAEIVKVKDKESTHFIVRNELREQMDTLRTRCSALGS